MGKDFDSDVEVWKKNIEKHCLISDMLFQLHSFVQEPTDVSELEVLPGGFQATDIEIERLDLTFQSTISPGLVGNPDTPSEDSDLADMEDFLVDVDVNDCAMNHPSTRENAFEKMLAINDNESSKEAWQTLNATVKSQIEGEWGAVDAVDVQSLQSFNNKNKPPSYQVIGDNIDLYVKVKHQASDRQNKSIHWFAMNAVQNRVKGEDLDNTQPKKAILDVENAEFLPSKEDNSDLLHDFVPLVARVLADKVPALKGFKQAVVRHIPHEFSKEMKQKSAQVSRPELDLHCDIC